MSGKDWNDVLKERGSLPSPWANAVRMQPPKQDERKAVEVELSSFFLGDLLNRYGWVGPRLQPAMWACRCPSEALHTSGARFDGSTRLCAPDKRFPNGRINCTHPACRELWVDVCFIGNAIQRIAHQEGI